MKRLKSRRRVWPIGVVAFVAILVGGFAVQSLLLPRTADATAEPSLTTANTNPIDSHQEPVGWVFGRVVGFEGADKPMLPRRSFPTMNGRNSL